MDSAEFDKVARAGKPAPGQSPAGKDRAPQKAARFYLAFSERKLLLFTLDAAMLAFSLALTLGITGGPLPFAPAGLAPGFLARLAGLALVWGVVGIGVDAYNLKAADSRTAGPLRAIKAVTITAAVLALLPGPILPEPGRWPSGLLFGVLAATGLGGWRFVYASLLARSAHRTPIIIMGAGSAGQYILRLLQDRFDADYEVVGFIDDEPARQGLSFQGIRVLGAKGVLVEVVRAHRVREIVLALESARRIEGEVYQLLVDCQALGARVVPMASLYEHLTGSIPVEQIEHDYYVLLPPNHFPAMPGYSLLRRLIDIAVSLLGLACFALMLPVLALAIRLDSPGPVFYRQQRVGQGGRHFWMLKLRTMIAGAEKDGRAVWARVGDARVTRFGRFARRVRLDEVPQFWNILKGDMTLIGPRPERPELVASLEQQIPFFRSRNAVKPGITGWAQVNHGYGASLEDALVKLRFDLYYIKHQSPYLDLLILWKTLQVILQFRGT